MQNEVLAQHKRVVHFSCEYQGIGFSVFPVSWPSMMAKIDNAGLVHGIGGEINLTKK